MIDFLNFTEIPTDPLQQNVTIVMAVHDPFTQIMLIIQTACLIIILLILLKRKTITYDKEEDQ